MELWLVLLKLNYSSCTKKNSVSFQRYFRKVSCIAAIRMAIDAMMFKVGFEHIVYAQNETFTNGLRIFLPLIKLSTKFRIWQK